MGEYEYDYISIVEADEIIQSYMAASDGEKPFLALWNYGDVEAYELVCFDVAGKDDTFSCDHVYVTPEDAELLVAEFDLDVTDCRD
jgi:IMP cyclohydrolase